MQAWWMVLPPWHTLNLKLRSRVPVSDEICRGGLLLLRRMAVVGTRGGGIQALVRDLQLLGRMYMCEFRIVR